MTRLTYNIFSYPTFTELGADQRTVDKLTEKAFSIWQKDTNLKFERKSSAVRENQVDIAIKFVKRKHGDGWDFHGVGLDLAHAFDPGQDEISGDVHIDDDEDWSVKRGKGTQLLQVLVHELGHSLGLDHSKVKGAIMQGPYQGWLREVTLRTDNIQRIQKLYGKPKRKGR